MDDNGLLQHRQKIQQTQQSFLSLLKKRQHPNKPISLCYGKGQSNVTRSKKYKKQSDILDLAPFADIIAIDVANKKALVEPRATMDQLLQAALPLGLMPAVAPEFKGITVGGAILGTAAESSSHRYGCFHDNCLAYELLCGDGNVIVVSPQQHQDLFYGIAGSYGSLGTLLSAEILLVPASPAIKLSYHRFSSPDMTLRHMIDLYSSSHPPQFLDGLALARDHFVIVESYWPSSDDHGEIPKFSMQSSTTPWYYQHVMVCTDNLQDGTTYTELMDTYEYLFRYDLGAFWMGAYLFNPRFLFKFLAEGYFKLTHPPDGFSPRDISFFYQQSPPSTLWRTLLHSQLSSQKLWALLHSAEQWVQQRVVIQDFCLPPQNALSFLEESMRDPAIYPIWLCPIHSSHHPTLFAPNADTSDSHVINIGLYGIPHKAAPISAITHALELNVKDAGGRKVLYSHSYYSPEHFWQIYPKDAYENLRLKTHADGVWHDITAKVLSD